MRVLVVTDWTSEVGGVETYVQRLIQGLSQRGHDVRLLVSSVGPGASGADYVAPGYESSLAQVVTQVANLAAARAVRQVESTWRPDVIHASTVELQLSPTALLAVRTPFVLNIAWHKATCPTGHRLLPGGGICRQAAGFACVTEGCVGVSRALREVPRYVLLRRLRSRASAIVTCSSYMSRALEALGIDALPLRLAVDVPRGAPRRVPASEPVVVASGRLSPEKGLDLLVRAVARLRAEGAPVRLRLIGDGPARGALEALARSEGIADAIEVTGWLPHSEVWAALADAWLLCAPSRWAEPLGLGAIEAILLGIPVVASAVGGYGETIEPGRSGLLVPNGDAAALTEAIEAVVEGRVFPRLVVDAAAQASLAQRHDPSRHFAEVEGILEEARR